MIELVSQAVLSLAIAFAGMGGGGAAKTVPLGSQVTVLVQVVSAQGTVSPLADAEVVLEVWTSKPGGKPALTRTIVQQTQANGQALITGLKPEPNAQVVASVVYGGLTFTGRPSKNAQRAQPIVVRVYEQTPSTQGLKLGFFAGVDVRETVVLIDETVRLDNSTRQVMAPKEGISIPLVLPAIGDAPWTGYLPPESAVKHISTQASPERGRVVVERGGVTYYGPIMPGEQQRIRVRYAIPIARERQDLAIAAPFDFSRIVLVGRWSKRIKPRLIPSRLFTARSFERGETLERQIVLDEPPKQGEHLTIHFDRLPYTLAVASVVATYGSIILIVLFGLVVFAGRRRT